MKYLIIGLGNLGRALARDLTSAGNEVIGVDRDEQVVEEMKQSVSSVVALDSTDINSLNSLPLSDMDAIIVTFEKDFGTSVKTVAQLKSVGAKKLIVRSISPVHETVVRAIGVDSLIKPEEDYAATFAAQLMMGDTFEQWYRLSESHHICKIKLPQELIGQRLIDIDWEKQFGVKFIAVESPTIKKNLIGNSQTVYHVIEHPANDFTLQENDRIILFGKVDMLRKFALT